MYTIDMGKESVFCIYFIIIISNCLYMYMYVFSITVKHFNIGVYKFEH